MSIYLIPTIPALGNVEQIQCRTGLRAVVDCVRNRVELVDLSSIKRPTKPAHTPSKAARPQGMDKPFGGDAA